MQSVSSRIWTRVAVFISYDDNHFTTATSNYYYLQLTTFITFFVSDLFLQKKKNYFNDVRFSKRHYLETPDTNNSYYDFESIYKLFNIIKHVLFSIMILSHGNAILNISFDFLKTT